MLFVLELFDLPLYLFFVLARNIHAELCYLLTAKSMDFFASEKVLKNITTKQKAKQ